MTIEQLFDLDIAKLEAMSDEELKQLTAPLIPLVRAPVDQDRAPEYKELLEKAQKVFKTG